MVEFAIVVSLLGALIAGVVELGRTWGALQAVSTAARDGARLAAVTPSAVRESVVTSRVRALTATFFPAEDVRVTISSTTVAAGPIVTVSVTGSLHLLFGTSILGNGTDDHGHSALNLTRSASLRDELAPPS